MDLWKSVREIEEDVVAYRRHIHENPELSLKEFDTADFDKTDYFAEIGFNFAGIGQIALALTANANTSDGNALVGRLAFFGAKTAGYPKTDAGCSGRLQKLTTIRSKRHDPRLL